MRNIIRLSSNATILVVVFKLKTIVKYYWLRICAVMNPAIRGEFRCVHTVPARRRLILINTNK